MFHKAFLLITGIVLATVLGVLSIPAVSRAEAAPLSEEQAVGLLRGYGIVRGDPSGDLGLNRRLSRAEAAVIFIRSRGAEVTARMVAGEVPFLDARGHWAAGEITLADRLGLMKGDGNGLFRPNDEITYAEVLTVLLRMVQREPAGAWDPNKVWAAADQAGFAPAGQLPSAPAVRGKIFWSLASAVTRVTLPTGLNVLQTYVDSVPPGLRLDQAVLQTKAETVTVTGRATDAVQVTVGGKAATFNAATGAFQADVSLEVGINAILVQAVDAAGNKETAEVRAERSANIASLRIEGPATIQAGTSQKLTITATDPRGRAVPLNGVKAELTGNLGQFDLASGTLTVGQQTGRGTLTLRSEKIAATYTFDVTGLSSRAAGLQVSVPDGVQTLTVMKEVQVKVQVVDAAGQAVTDDFWRPVTLEADGAVLNPAQVVTSKGVATFKLTPSLAGTLALRASSPGLPDARVSLPVYTQMRVVLSASPATLVPDGISVATVRATLQDGNGRAVTNTTGHQMVIDLVKTGGSDWELNDYTLTISAGASSSAGTGARFRAGLQPSGATIAGRFASAHDLSILPVTVTASQLAGVRLAITQPTGAVAPGSTGTTLELQVLDAHDRVVTSGSYAFQLTAATSAGDAAVNGLPPGLTLTFYGTDYMPVYDGRAPGDPGRDPLAVVGRTYQGRARLRLAYDRSGVITLKPVLVGPNYGAYNPTSGEGPAAGSAGMTAQPAQITFAGAPAKIVLKADSKLGLSVPAGAGTPGTTFKVHAQVVDAGGAPVPGYGQTITLRRVSGDSVTAISGSASRAAVQGVADFVVKSSGSIGYDVYEASAGVLTRGRLTISVRNEVPETPEVVAVRGETTGDPSPETSFVGPDADYLDIQLAPQGPQLSGEPDNWVMARVFRKGETAAIYSGPVNLAAEPPIVQVPKEKLARGRAVYLVSVHNGYAESERSPDLGLSEAVNAVYYDGYGIKSAWFDSATGRLFLATSGLDSTGTLNPGLLSIARGDETLSLADLEVSVVSVSSSGVMLDLGALAAEITPDRFGGAAVVKAASGWYSGRDGSQVARAVTGAALKPIAVINYAMLDVPAKRLYLQGTGLSQGTLNLQMVQVEQGLTTVALKPGSSSTTDRVVSSTDALITIALSPATLQAIDALTGPEIHVTARAGWLKTTYGGTTYSAAEVTGLEHGLYTKAAVSKVSYDKTSGTLTLRGSGFTGADFDPALLNFRTSGSTTAWRPAQAATVTVKDDATILVVLGTGDASAFQSRFHGRQVYLNTDAGWLVDGKGREAAPVPQNSILFSVP